MRTVSFQGVQLTANQRFRVQQQQQLRGSFINPVLSEQVDQALKTIEARKEKGVQPEKLWFKDRDESGTPSVAEWMGY